MIAKASECIQTASRPTVKANGQLKISPQKDRSLDDFKGKVNRREMIKL